MKVLERKNCNISLNKSNKVKLTTKFNTFNQENQKYYSHMIKFDFNGLSEIIEHY